MDAAAVPGVHIAGDEGRGFVIHDRDSIFSREIDSSLRLLGVKPLRTPYRAPRANSFCERLIGVEELAARCDSAIKTQPDRIFAHDTCHVRGITLGYDECSLDQR
jgi:hypothetical protein